ncbi:MAG: PAS domain S-box protein [Campylobacterota bacterium]|nr:PAS domain S-box protein [Campylobacterota bacterium]
MRLKLILTTIFLIVCGLFVYLNTQNKNERINLALDEQLKDLHIHYALTKDYFITDAKSIKNNISCNQKIIDIFSQAQNASDEEKDILRKELHQFLVPMYGRMKSRGLLQFQFVFKNNVSFLRMHKPNKFGDDLTDIRYSFKYANEIQQDIEGFEQGRTTHAFRYVFPFYDKKNNHLGAIEISLSSFALQEKLLSVDKIHSHFLVKKDVFDVKAWKTDGTVKNYMESIEHEDYLFTTTKHSNAEKMKKSEQFIIKPLKENINYHISVDKPFTLYTPIDETIKVIAFLPIKNIKDKKTVAYLVSYTNNDGICHVLKNYYVANAVMLIVMLLLFYFIYKNLVHKKELQIEVINKTAELKNLNENLEQIVEEKTEDLNDKNRELKSLISSYDKNVMYSSTDLEGIITDVSDAFCRVSGYTREELIGQNHNIVRHPENPASIFEDLWNKLVKEESFYTEIKNLKKDGGYFWIKSFYAPEYDKYGTHIGYTAVRDNITDRKEVEELHHEIEATQKEVIFTMGAIGESRSKETGNHVKRVAEYSKIFALHYGLSEKDAELLKQASPMHDIGKVAIPDNILNKPAKLTDAEMDTIKNHSQLGFDMLHGSTRPLLNTAAIVAHEHHEKWDGSGYPQGLTALEIHVYGRITAIADVFDALGSERCYKKAWSDEKIFKLFKEERGKHFEPKLVDIFFDNLDDFLEIRDKLVDK